MRAAARARFSNSCPCCLNTGVLLELDAIDCRDCPREETGIADEATSIGEEKGETNTGGVKTGASSTVVAATGTVTARLGSILAKQNSMRTHCAVHGPINGAQAL
jgi:hypothetical protein